MLHIYRCVFFLLISTVSISCSKNDTSLTNANPSSHIEEVPISPLERLWRSAQAGDAKAQHLIAGRYLRGEGVEKNLTKSVQWEKKSAAQGYIDAQVQLANDYAQGLGVSKSMANAKIWARKAASKGNSDGQYLLGLIYINEEANPVEGAGLMQKAAAQGNVQAEFTLGMLYKNGYGVAQDDAKSIEWFRKAAAQGSANAQWEIGDCYAKGEGCPKNLSKALEWRQKAAAHAGAYSQRWSLGDCYAKGTEECPRDSAKAFELYRAAAAQGDADTQWMMGLCYFEGRICPKDSAKAVNWYEKAAAQGDIRTQFLLGGYYMGGAGGCPKDFAKAAEWFEKAAMQGDAASQWFLGQLYDSGDGVAKDATKAAGWFQKAALQGDTDAQSALAMKYKQGNGVARNFVLAYAWANLAASKGNVIARRLRNVLDRRMTSLQIADAQRLSSGWKPGSGFSHVRGSTASSSSSSSRILEKQRTGTLFIVNTDGFAVTNEHVINGCSKVQLKGRSDAVKIIAVDSANDLALLQIYSHFTSAATIAIPGRSRQGDHIVVFGFPLTGVLASGGNLTTGVVSSLTGYKNNTAQMQITAQIQPGSSGSPVMDSSGNVIGVVSSKLSDALMAKATGSIGENINFAISGQMLKSFLDANHVAYASNPGAGWLSREKKLADIADLARKWTYAVECWK